MADRSLHLPITWTGYRCDPHTLYLAGADGQQWSIDPVDALESGAFDLATDTPGRRDALRRYAESLRDGEPLAWPRIGEEVAHG
jgi:hypothetical protein